MPFTLTYRLQLKLEPGKEGANLVIVRPYHRHSALFGSRQIRKWRVVSDIQLYLDLHRYPLRGEEQASHLWDNGDTTQAGGRIQECADKDARLVSLP